MLNDVGLLKSFANDCVSKTYSHLFTQFQSFPRMFIMSQELCVNQRNEPSHIIVEILLNNMCTLGIISVFQMNYLQCLWYT